MSDYVWVWVPIIVVVGWVLRILLIAFLDTTGERRQMQWRIRVLERRVLVLNERLGIEPDEPDLTDVLDHLRRGQRMQAIKEYRLITGVSLGDATTAVEVLAHDHDL